MEVAQVLTVVLQQVVKDNDVVAWRRLLFFPYSVLRVPLKSDKVVNLTTRVKSRVKVWRDDPDAKVQVPPMRSVKPSDSKPQQLAQIVAKAEAKLADGDVRGAIRLVSSDDVLAPRNQETYLALLEKHPEHPQPSDFPLPPEGPSDLDLVSDVELRKEGLREAWIVCTHRF